MKRALLSALVLAFCAFLTPSAFAQCSSSPCVVTSGSTFTVPSNFGSLVKVEVIAAGGNGGTGSAGNISGQGGKGGAYCQETSASFTAGSTYTIQIGTGGGTISAPSSSAIGGTANTGIQDNSSNWIAAAQGGQSGISSASTNSTAGSGANCVGTVVTASGGNGGAGNGTVVRGGGGGGGASGPNGNGGTGSASTTSAGGAGGFSDASLGGSGGGSGSNGSNGTELGGGIGAGGGAGGSPTTGTAGTGGNYGGGGGGGSNVALDTTGGSGANGVLIFTYNAKAPQTSSCTLLLLHAGTCAAPGIQASYFGMTINGPVQSPFTWPAWNPVTFRLIDQSDTTTGGSLPFWTDIETSLNTYVWTTFDPIAAAYIANGTKDVIWAFEGVPQWAEIGNAYTNTVTFAASVVTFTGTAPATINNGLAVFFNGGTLPSGLTAGTDYWIINYNSTAKTYQISATTGGSALTFTTGSGTTTATLENTPPSSQTYLTNFITQVLTRAALDGFNIAYVEGFNEPNNEPVAPGANGWQGSIADAVTFQQTIYNAVQSFNSSNGKSIKVLSPPVADAGSYFNSTYWGWQFLAAGGGSYFDILSYHAYPDSTNGGGPTNPEQVSSDMAQIQAAMVANSVSLSKLVWISEYSAGSGQSVATNTTFASVTSLIANTIGIGRQYWYAYDNGSGFGQMWTSAGGLNAAGVAWQQVTKWMIGATVTQTTFGVSLSSIAIPGSTGGNLTFTTTLPMNLTAGASVYVYPVSTNYADDIVGTVVSDVGTALVITVTAFTGSGTYADWAIQPPAAVATVNLSRSGGYQAQAVWTQDGSTPSYTYPAGMTQYHDLSGNVTALSGGTVTLGRNPILLENFSAF